MLFIFISRRQASGGCGDGVLARCCPPPLPAGRRAQLRAACQGAPASVSEFAVVVTAPAYACERARAFPKNLAYFSDKFLACKSHLASAAPPSPDLVSTKEHGDDVPEAIRKLEANDNTV